MSILGAGGLYAEARTKDLDILAKWVVGTAALPARLRGGEKEARVSCSLTDVKPSSSYLLYNVRMVMKHPVVAGRGIASRGQYDSGDLKHEYEDGRLDETTEVRERLDGLAERVRGHNPNLDVQVQCGELVAQPKRSG